ncbi:hypothetical protein EVAR_17231_1 [Eumeta japonica]|uniref:Uncharacterized protein n=1 Tax=Eumeta variegata TaxID=151549 RepID=A0A4C1U9Y5_EUMVA|nr:hypothetical protein EVAR_17231_1 [Eumeta japonica]
MAPVHWSASCTIRNFGIFIKSVIRHWTKRKEEGAPAAKRDQAASPAALDCGRCSGALQLGNDSHKSTRCNRPPAPRIKGFESAGYAALLLEDYNALYCILHGTPYDHNGRPDTFRVLTRFRDRFVAQLRRRDAGRLWEFERIPSSASSDVGRRSPLTPPRVVQKCPLLFIKIMHVQF